MAVSNEGKWRHVTTVGDAMTLVIQLFDRQLAAAAEAGSSPNEAVSGDGEARQAFLGLLPPPDQRSVFLSVIRNRSFWPRIRSLIGSPPYSFLNGADDAVLRAGGITKNRQHMAHQAASTPNSSEFGSSHFVDPVNRDYKCILRAGEGSVVETDSQRRGRLLPFIGLGPGIVVVMDVRIRRRRAVDKVAILRGASDISKDALRFPKIGERLVLEPSRLIRGAVGSLEITVRNIAVRVGSITCARLVVSVI